MWQMLRARQTYFIIGYRCHNTDNTATRDKTKHGATIMVSNNKTKKQIERSLYRTDSRWTGRKIPRFETVARSAGRNSMWNRIGWIHSPWIYLTMTNGSLDYSANRDSPPVEPPIFRRFLVIHKNGMDRANKPTDRKMAARESESPKSIENNPALTLVSASPFISNIARGR